MIEPIILVLIHSYSILIDIAHEGRNPSINLKTLSNICQILNPWARFPPPTYIPITELFMAYF